VTHTAKNLRETSDSLKNDLATLQALEEDKRSVEPDDPRLRELAERIENLARRVLGKSVRQRKIVEQVEQLVDAGSPEAPDRPIEELPRAIHIILAAWRTAEQQAVAAPAGSAEAEQCAEQINRLRAEYRHAYEAAQSSKPEA
jgi:hypothetical protein